MADIDRGEAAPLIPIDFVKEIFKAAEAKSVALGSFRRINMGTKTSRLPVLSALTTASFVAESATAPEGVKPTTDMAWTGLDLVAEEIAAIVPIHEDVIADSQVPIWDEVKTDLVEAIGATLDGAVLFGINRPTTWSPSLEEGARAAANVVSEASVVGLPAPPNDLAEAVNQTWAKVEEDGFDVNVQFASRSLRARLRGLRDADGQPIYTMGTRNDGATNLIYGEQLSWVTNGAWNPSVAAGSGANLIAGDRTKAIIGLRQDVAFKVLDQATVNGINLAERDMVALRVKFRVGFAVANPVTREGGAGSYPFAILEA